MANIKDKQNEMIKCNMCNKENDIDSDFCSSCGKSFKYKDLDRDFRAGKIFALDEITTKIINKTLLWLGLLSAIIGTLTYVGYDKIVTNNEEELKKIEKSYKDLLASRKILSNLYGEETSFQDMAKHIVANFNIIKDIEIKAEYIYNKKLKVHPQLPPFSQNISLIKNNYYETKPFIEFRSLDRNAIGDKNLLVRYKPYFPFELNLYSKSSINELDNIKYITFSSIHQNIFEPQLAGVKDTIEHNTPRTINLYVYVNSLLFWTVHINNPKIEILTRKTCKTGCLEVRSIFRQDISKQIISTQKVMRNYYQNVSD